MEQQLNKIMSAVFNVKEGDIDDHSSMDSIGQWDSLKHMELIIAIEEHYGITFPAHEIVRMTTVENIKQVLSSHTGGG